MTCMWTRTNSNVNTPHKFNLFSTVIVKLQTINNKLKRTNNGQKKQKDWSALDEVKAGEAAEGGLHDEPLTDRLEEEDAFWVESAFTHKEKDFSLGTHSEKSTCVCFGTERLTPLAHSVLVLALSYTSLGTLLCHGSLLWIRCHVVIIIIVRLGHRCRWCKLLLFAHLDAPRVGVVIRVMLNVAAAEACFQPEPAPAVCFQRTEVVNLLSMLPLYWPFCPAFSLLQKKWKNINF